MEKPASGIISIPVRSTRSWRRFITHWKSPAKPDVRLHIVHVSSGAGVALVASARKQGVDVTCETCPHYLVLTEDDVVQLGALAKCAPPLRTKSAQDVLWRYVEGGHVATIGSDHSPSPPEMKQDCEFLQIVGWDFRRCNIPYRCC